MSDADFIPLPPGPPIPSAVQTAIWFGRAQRMLSECAARYGDTFTLRIIPEGTWVVLSDPEHVKQVFTGDPRVFHAGEANRILLPVLGPSSLLLLDERAHLEQRRLLLPPFHGARMQAYGELMAQMTRDEIAAWPREQAFSLHPRMQALTLEIILAAVFGMREGERMSRLRGELRRLLMLLTKPRMMLLPVLMGPERLARSRPFRSLLAGVERPLREEIAERRRAGDLDARDDILSLLMSARHESDGSPMSEGELRDELLTLLVAGHETTATALAWALERLVRHPEKLRRLREEALAGETAYRDAVIQETLRLRPVISLVARRLTEPVQVGRWELPAGVTVAPSIYLMHRRPDIYPDPEAFRPERFLEDPPGTYTWIPFGGGVRRCIGGAFAQFEMGVVLDEIVKQWLPVPARAPSERVQRRAIFEAPEHNAEVVLR